MNIPDKCQRKTKERRVVVEEKLSKITFINDSLQQVTVVTVDGCAITEGIRCDYLLIDNINKEYFVELKGKDIKRAVSQLERTIEVLSKDKQRQAKWCFIISTRCPLFTTEIQNLKIKFKRRYNSTLIIKNKYHEHHL